MDSSETGRHASPWKGHSPGGAKTLKVFRHRRLY
jgi:hypothetical protein